MGKVYLMLLIVATMVLGSCKKCKEKDCQNDASCSLLNNEAVCACKEFYKGERCETVALSTYVGVYNGSTDVTVGGLEIDGSNTDYTLERSGSSVTEFTIKSTASNATGVFSCRLTTEDEFNVVSISNTGSTNSVSISGSGSISSTGFSMSGSITESDRGSSVTYTFETSARR